MNKEEKLLYSLSAIKNIFECFDIDVEIKIEKNDKEYIVNAYKEIEKCIVDYVNSLQPYKFKDLKVEMFVFDCVKSRVNKIIEIFEHDFGIPYIKFDDGFGEWFIIEFEEDRFYPVTKALQYQEKEIKKDE